VAGTPPRTKKRKPFLLDLYSTAVGKKYVMAITGLIGVGYVIAHLVGNLKVYLGAEEIDHYGEFLRELLVPLLPRTVALWLLRLVLIGALALHLHAAYTLTLINRRARPDRYQSPRDYIAANFASRTMRWTGIIVLLFLFYHLADLTWGWFNPDFVRGAVYHNLDESLSQIPVAILYIVANIALGIHLFHGVWSLFQSMGWNNPRFNSWRRGIATAIATLIVVGNCSFPIAVQAGIVQT
jgi:succinate dehydrogenase / fumarate reductase cytochrome b subunit